MTTIYLLHYDHDTGAREEWNTFYTPCEAFAKKIDRDNREIAVKLEDTTLETYAEEIVLQ